MLTKTLYRHFSRYQQATGMRLYYWNGTIAALDDCDNPSACPHGRPTIIEVDFAELEDRFERDYPGHTGRRD